MQHHSPISVNEMERLLNLSEFDIDYSNLENNFKDLIYLAAKIAGTDISIINLIDTYTQWSIANYGIDTDQTPREDTVCNYTILNDDHFEIKDLSADERFLNKDFVKNPLNLRYYFGIPLKTAKGYNLGALCVMDSEKKTLSHDKIEQLKLIANEILVRLNTIKLVNDLKKELHGAKETQQKIVHDIRSPLSGIIGITEMISEQGDKNDLTELLEMIEMIHTTSKSVIELTDEILANSTQNNRTNNDLNLSLLKSKLIKLYGPQALNKDVDLLISCSPQHQKTPFPKEKLLQISGNLIANAIKFTPKNGTVKVELGLEINGEEKTLKVIVTDTGNGIDQDSINEILNGGLNSTIGTSGEKGFGLGLPMVKKLVGSLGGNLEISSSEGNGSKFTVTIPV